MFKPYLLRRLSWAMLFPMMLDFSPTLSSDRLFETPYSFTSSFSVLRSCLFLFLESFDFERYILLKGMSTAIPTSTQMIPTGRNEKNDNPW